MEYRLDRSLRSYPTNHLAIEMWDDCFDTYGGVAAMVPVQSDEINDDGSVKASVIERAVVIAAALNKRAALKTTPVEMTVETVYDWPRYEMEVEYYESTRDDLDPLY